MLTMKRINKEAQKYKLEIVKGDGYFYFVSDERKDIWKLFSTTVYVYKINDLSLEQWIAEIIDIDEQIKQYGGGSE